MGVDVASKVHDCRFLRLKRCSTPHFPFRGLFNYRLDAFKIALRRWAGYRGCEVINESDCSSVRINSALNQVRVEEQICDGRQGEPCGRPACGRSSTSESCPLS